MDAWDGAIDVFKYASVEQTEDAIFFEGKVFYEHVFSNAEVIEEPFAYCFLIKSRKMMRMPNPTGSQSHQKNKNPN